jgi:hypothetical protein
LRTAVEAEATEGMFKGTNEATSEDGNEGMLRGSRGGATIGAMAAFTDEDAFKDESISEFIPFVEGNEGYVID